MLLPAVLSPIIAGLIALIATYLAYRITSRGRDGTVKQGFKLGQIVSASMVALAHGTNDAQKTMGIITLTLITAGALPPDAGPPFWVILSAGLAIALGTYLGGWRIIQTLGKRVSDIQPPQGFAAETSSADRDPRLVAPGLPAVHHPGRHRFDLRRRGAAAGWPPCSGASRARSRSRGR